MTQTALELEKGTINPPPPQLYPKPAKHQNRKSQCVLVIEYD
jgi:hypothetical protein